MKQFRFYNSISFLIICLFFSFFSTSSYPYLSYLGYGFMAVLYVLSFVNIAYDVTRKVSLRVFLAAIFVGFAVILFMLNTNTLASGLTTIVQLLCIYAFVRYTQTIDMSIFSPKKFTTTNITLMIVFYLIAAIRLLYGVGIMFHNYASIAPLALCLTAFNFAIYKICPGYKSINFVGYLPLLILCRGRNAIICVIIFFVWYRFINIKTTRGKIFGFIVLLFVVYLITVQYPLLYHTELGNKLEALSFSYTKKSFFSGRQIIWRNILDLMSGHELLGYGTGTLYNSFYLDTRSAHNQYLQLYLQNGLVGLAFLLVVLYGLWNSIIKNKNHTIVGTKAYSLCKVSESFYVVMVIYNIFSVSMLQNSMTTANFFWFIVALGINQGTLKQSHDNVGSVESAK